MWDNLPDDVHLHIFRLRAQAMSAERKAVRMQSAWRGYRTRVLIGRFHMLRYLQTFREWNPTLVDFLHKSKL